MANLSTWFLQWVHSASGYCLLITEAAPELLPLIALAPSYAWALHLSTSIYFVTNKDKMFLSLICPVEEQLMRKEPKNVSYITGKPFWKVT